MSEIITDIEEIKSIIYELKSVPDIFIGETVRFCTDQKNFNQQVLSAMQAMEESISVYSDGQSKIIKELRERIRELESVLDIRYAPKEKEYIQ